MTGLRSVVMVPTWVCPNNCSYCSVPVDWRTRSEDSGISPEAWAERINSLGDVMLDWTGGEPACYPGIVDLGLALDRPVAVTSSLKPRIDVWQELGDAGAIRHITCSYHRQLWDSASDFLRAAEEVAAHVPGISISIVRGHESIEEIVDRGFRIGINLYDHPIVKSRRKMCTAGVHNINVSPDGQVYRCWQWQRLGQGSLGNLWGTWHLLPAPAQCDILCANCYFEGQFGVEVGKEGDPC